MSTQYTLSYQVSLPLLQRAMTSWAKPRRTAETGLNGDFLVQLGVGAVGVAVLVAGMSGLIPTLMWTGMLIGFCLGLAFWLVMHRRDLRRLSGYTLAHLEKQGPMRTVISAAGVETQTALGSSMSTWAAFDQVIEMPDATALRAGAVIYPIPHSCLQQDVRAADFHADLVAWQQAAP